jgi:hypothetical protein
MDWLFQCNPKRYDLVASLEGGAHARTGPTGRTKMPDEPPSPTLDTELTTNIGEIDKIPNPAKPR